MKLRFIKHNQISLILSTISTLIIVNLKGTDNNSGGIGGRQQKSLFGNDCSRTIMGVSLIIHSKMD